MITSISSYHLAYVFPTLDSSRATFIASCLFNNLDYFNLISETAIAHFLSQAGHESMGFKNTSENLNYSNNALIAKFGRHRISLEDAKKYGRSDKHAADQQMIANKIYGGAWGQKNLGNDSDTSAADGWKFHGRGFIQLTGKSNYKAFSDFYKKTYNKDINLIENPEILATDLELALISALWFFKERVLEKTNIEFATVEKVTSLVNGGNLGLEERRNYFNKARLAFSPNFLTDLISNSRV